MPRSAIRVSLLLVLACCRSGPTLDRPLRLEGVQSVARSTLEELIARILAAGGKGTDADRAAAGVAAYYRYLGYADVTVEVPPQSADRTLALRVAEGRHWRIAELTVTGNDARTSEELLALFDPQAAPDSSPSGAPYIDDQVAAWWQRVVASYTESGYLDAVVRKPVVERDAAAGTVRINLEIAREGARYRIREFLVDDRLRALLGADLPPVPAGDHCTRAAVEGWGEMVGEALRRRGYPRPRLGIDSERHADTGEVTIRVSSRLGNPQRIGKIVVQGNRRVPDQVILDRFGLRPGERFDGDKEQFGRSAALATGDLARLDVDYRTIDADNTDLVLDAGELQGFTLRGLFNLHPWRRLAYGLLAEWRDLLGDRQDLVAQVSAGHRGYATGFRTVHGGIVDELTTLRVGGDFYYDEQPAFTDRGAGATVEIERYVSPNSRAQAALTFVEHFDTTFDAVSTTTAGRDYRECRLTLLVEHDHRDSRIQPTEGLRGFARWDWDDDSLGSEVELQRLRIGGGLWTPIAPGLRAWVEGESGWLWPGAGSATVPVVERFFLGGFSTVRSFREGRLGPRDSGGRLQGGEYRNFVRTEIDYAVVGDSRFGSLELALFADAGNIGAQVEDWTLEHLRWAVGFGLRLTSPQALPVRLDAAWNPDRVPGEDEWVVNFAAGVDF